MQVIDTNDARGGVGSRNHNVLTVLVASLALTMGAWFVVETFF